jgi:hypothetical protein
MRLPHWTWLGLASTTLLVGLIAAFGGYRIVGLGHPWGSGHFPQPSKEILLLLLSDKFPKSVDWILRGKGISLSRSFAVRVL